MKTLTLLFTILLSFPFALTAQSVGDVLQTVAVAMSAGQTEKAVSLFQQAIQQNVDKAEMFYWTNVDKNSDICVKMADELASHYKRMRNYDKAYLFYKELLQRKPNDVGYLVSCAEMEVARGKEQEALRTYKKVMELNADNLAANIFIGNYLYLMAEQEKQQLERDYKKINAPTRMQHARYRDGLSRVLTTGYNQAKEYLQNVVRQFPSTEARKTLEKIQRIEKEINR